MSDRDESALGATRSTLESDAAPGVPGFRTWRGVYWFVFAGFVGVVLALTIFSRLFA